LHLFGQTVSVGSGIFLLLALGMALSFEFVNGFHDTANAVATVIYTHSLKPTVAVVWSGCWNLIGVLTSSGAVAFGVLALLPVELVLNVGSGAGFAMVFALLISAIIWNLGTWYLGLPASSSHSLVGAILGVGLANSWHSGANQFGEGINWAKATEVGASLLISPVVGFGCSALLLLLCKFFIRKKELYTAPDKDKTPPSWIRGLLVLTCTGVSFAHGSNDGQKGMGLIMLILVGILPLSFAVDLGTSQNAITDLASTTQTISFQMDRHSPGVAMGGYQIAADELSSYFEDQRQSERPHLRCDRNEVPRDLRDFERQNSVERTGRESAADSPKRSVSDFRKPGQADQAEKTGRSCREEHGRRTEV
jgi:PiT family inorganic phosphate transporter